MERRGRDLRPWQELQSCSWCINLPMTNKRWSNGEEKKGVEESARREGAKGQKAEQNKSRLNDGEAERRKGGR